MLDSTLIWIKLWTKLLQIQRAWNYRRNSQLKYELLSLKEHTVGNLIEVTLRLGNKVDACSTSLHNSYNLWTSQYCYSKVRQTKNNGLTEKELAKESTWWWCILVCVRQQSRKPAKSLFFSTNFVPANGFSNLLEYQYRFLNKRN
jgi:hypothetical protein